MNRLIHAQRAQQSSALCRVTARRCYQQRNPHPGVGRQAGKFSCDILCCRKSSKHAAMRANSRNSRHTHIHNVCMQEHSCHKRVQTKAQQHVHEVSYSEQKGGRQAQHKQDEIIKATQVCLRCAYLMHDRGHQMAKEPDKCCRSTQTHCRNHLHKNCTLG